MLKQDYNTLLANRINEKYCLVIAAWMLRPISKNKSPVHFMGADVIANLMARACFLHI